MNKAAIALLIAAVAVVGSNALALSPIAGAVAGSFAGMAAADVMVAAAFYGLAVACGALTIAPLADRIGAERSLAAAIAALACALAISAAAPSFALFVLGQATAGLAAGAALPAAYALAAQIAPPGRENQVMGAVLTGWTVSMVLGVAAAAAIADAFHWRWAHGGLAAITAFLACAIAARRDWGAAPERAARAASPLAALRTPGVVPALLVCVAFMSAFYGSYSYLGPHAGDALGASALGAGLFAIAYGAGFGLAQPLDRFLDQVGPARAAPPVFAVLIAIYLAQAAAAHAPATLGALAFCWGLVNHFGLNLIVNRLASIAPSRRGAVLGLYGAATYLCVFVGAVGFRPLYDQWGYAGCCVAAAACVAPALIDAALRARRDQSPKPPVGRGGAGPSPAREASCIYRRLRSP